MNTLQLIGAGTVFFLIYNLIYLPFIKKEQVSNQLIDNNIEILSFSYNSMRDLFRPHVNREYKLNEDGDYVLVKGCTKVFNRFLYFSDDTEINEFKKKVYSLYKELNSNPQIKIHIDAIYREHRANSEKLQIEKANKFLQLRKNFLDYNKLMDEIFLNDKIKLEREEVINKLSNKLHLSNFDATQLFEKLSDHTTGIIYWSSSKDGKTDLFWYSEFLVNRKTVDDMR